MRHEDFIEGVRKRAGKAMKADVVQPKVTEARIIWDVEPSNPGWFVRFKLDDGQTLDTDYMMPEDPEATETELWEAADEALDYEGYPEPSVAYSIVGGNPGEEDPEPE
jgi:hypothetical protein